MWTCRDILLKLLGVSSLYWIGKLTNIGDTKTHTKLEQFFEETEIKTRI